MLRVAPNLSERIARGQVVTLVSATNGKSVTTAMITAALRAHDIDVATNDGGANMLPGIATALAGRRDATHAVLETDEAVLPAAIKALRPALIVLGELTRDQLDRHHEVLKVAATWRDAFTDTNARFVAPVNDPNVVWSLQGQPVDWVDVDAHAGLDSVVCPQCHSILHWESSSFQWSCTCGLVRPTARVVQRGDEVTIDGRRYAGPIALRGRWQYANRALAVTAANALGVPFDVALDATARVEHVGTRPNTLRTPSARGAPVVLVKNPAGWAALIDDLRDQPTAVLFVQNDHSPDGRDPSWLWDVPFEELAPRRIIASGTRSLDVAVRMQTAGLDVIGIEADPLRAIEHLEPPEGMVVAASYSAYYDLSRRAPRQ